jgi:CRP-like cAMP-binding protein
MEGLDRIIRGHAFFAGLDEDFVKLVTGCSKNVRFEAGQYLFREGGPADEFFLLREGRVALELAAPGKGAISILTASEGEVVGFSWLVPPNRWVYDGRATGLVRAISIDGACLRNKCEADHDLGYEMMKRVVAIVIKRLHDTRLQSLDVYNVHA